MTTDIPLDIGGKQQDPSHQRRHDLSPQDKDPPPADITTCTVPQEVISVEAEMTAFDDRPTRRTVRPLHANTQGEGSREWEGNDAPPSDGETQMAPLQLSPKRNKKLKTDWETLLSRERTRSKTRYKTAQIQ